MEKMVLRTENLVKRYRNRTVVNHVSIDVKQGEIVGLLGPNGAGKTTTFYMTVGLITPNEGKIFLDDKDITKFPVYMRARNGIGYLAQEPSVFRKLSVEDNIRAVLEMTEHPEDYQKDKLEGLIVEFGLQKVRKNLGDQLSGGEIQRTAIARSMARQPKILIADEPTGNLDPENSWGIVRLLEQINEYGTTILVTTHDEKIVNRLRKRVVTLKDGQIVEDQEKGRYDLGASKETLKVRPKKKVVKKI